MAGAVRDASPAEVDEALAQLAPVPATTLRATVTGPPEPGPAANDGSGPVRRGGEFLPAGEVRARGHGQGMTGPEDPPLVGEQLPEVGDRSGGITGLSPQLGEFLPGFQSFRVVWAEDAELVLNQLPESSRGAVRICGLACQ